MPGNHHLKTGQSAHVSNIPPRGRVRKPTSCIRVTSLALVRRLLTITRSSLVTVLAMPAVLNSLPVFPVCQHRSDERWLDCSCDEYIVPGAEDLNQPDRDLPLSGAYPR
jgi:hypothetical protein